jgi:hypothetical protein
VHAGFLQDPGVYERIILRWIFRKWDGVGRSMDWVDLTQDRDRWRAHVHAEMNILAP